MKIRALVSDVRGNPIRELLDLVWSKPGSGHDRSGNVLADVFVLRSCQLADIPVKRYFPVTQNQEAHGNVAVLAARQYA